MSDIQWALNQFGWSTCGKTSQKLPDGMYSIRESRGEFYFIPRQILSDELIRFSEGIITNVLKEIEKFWTLKKKFDAYNFLPRRGMLLFGADT